MLRHFALLHSRNDGFTRREEGCEVRLQHLRSSFWYTILYYTYILLAPHAYRTDAKMLSFFSEPCPQRGGILRSTEGGRSGSPRGFLAYAPVFSAEERLGTKEISEGQRKSALYVKKELLAEARSQTAFSTEEKAAIGKLMLTEAHLYDFSEEERDAVFSALRR